MDRITKNRETTELYETKEKLESVRNGYFSAFRLMKDEEKIFVVNGDRSIEEIAKEIEEIVFGKVF